MKWLAPCNPQSMPIENFFHCVKSVLRRREVRQEVLRSDFSAKVLRPYFEFVGTAHLCQELMDGCGYYSLHV